MFLIYDTETTGLPKSYNAPISDSHNWPRMVQLAWQVHDNEGNLVSNQNHIVYPEGYTIPFNSAKIHGITTEKAQAEGKPLKEVLDIFAEDLAQIQYIIGHNIEFDQNIVGAELYRMQMDTSILAKKLIDTKEDGTDYCAIPGGRGGKFKWPKLGELHQKLFGEAFDEAHNASADVNATARCFFELLRISVIPAKKVGWDEAAFQAFKKQFPDIIQPYDIEITTQVADFNEQMNATDSGREEVEVSDIESEYFHFHNHTCFSILSASTQIEPLIKKAAKEGMPAVGMTDMGNLMGAFHFLQAVSNHNKSVEKPIIPIVGCEFYVAEHYLQKQFTKDQPDRRFTQLLIAKNMEGFKNLSLLSSYGYIDGYYAGYPRISKELIEQHKENLMATTGSISSEIPNLILNVGEEQAEEAFKYWHELFGDDFYVELLRHGLPEEDHANEVLIQFAQKYGVKIIAQNNTFYLDRNDHYAHDILLCVRDGEKKSTPIGRGRDFRFGMPNDQFYFKSQEEMKALFSDYPEAIDNLKDILQKCEPYELKREVLLPKFNIPDEFKVPEDEKDGGVRGENAYLKHITYEGAKKRYGEITNDIKERLDFELATIENTGYPGYFLIVQDFTSQARKMGVSVGPGRGSAAGSAVAYCIGITNVDPIKYDLLFERFLNPDRVSLPDIDIDFDDRGRDEIINWVLNKYGKDQVAQIITYGTMAGKSAIRDTARVLDLPLREADTLSKKTHMKLNKLFSLSESELKKSVSSDLLGDLMDIKKIAEQDTLEGETLQQAKVIEGSVRNTGIHACGVIITPTDIKELIPVTISKESDLLVTQFDNSVVESAGLLKMDFLGLRTLTIIKDAIQLIEEKHGVKIDPDEIPLDDEKTYEIFQKGQTGAIFQYESAGMQKHLKALKPDKFDDLIAMNALYRPGPIQYIPNFIARKHGKEEISYDLPAMEDNLKETYGITVYQEQVMLLSQKLANFTKGMADELRKGMGKKQKHVIDKLYPKFIEGGTANGHPEKVLNKIWKDWEAFASYAFNKSHSTCYALIGYHTAYLKAHYPAEFMAAVLSNNMNNIKSISFFMEECKRMGLSVLGPDINESGETFTVNAKGAVRFGMSAVKGAGSNAIENIVKEREENGEFTSIFDVVKRIDLRAANKKTFEALALAGAFDNIGIHRGELFFESDGSTNLEKLLKFGSAFQDNKNSSQQSLFADVSEEVEVAMPQLVEAPEWHAMQTLSKEKEVVGVYISAHPLDNYQMEIKHFQSISFSQLKEQEEKLVGRELSLAGMVTEVQHRVSNKDGKEFGIFTMEDYTDSYEFMLFGEDYLKFKHFLQRNMFLFMKMKLTVNQYSNRIYKNIHQMIILDEVIEKFGQKLQLELNLMDLNEDLLTQLQDIFNTYEGDKTVSIKVKKEKQMINFPVRKRKLRLDKDLLLALEDLKVLKYKVN